MTHPYTTHDNLPSLCDVDYASMRDQILEIIQDYRNLVDQVANLNEPLTWDNFVRPFEIMDDRFEKFIHPLYHLEAVDDCPEVREAVKAIRGPLVDMSIYVGQHQRLAERLQEFRDSSEYDQLSPAQKVVIDRNLKNLRLSGIFLEGEDKQRFNELSLRSSELNQKYSNTVLDAKNAWFRHIKPEESQALLSGVPDEILNIYADEAKNREVDGYAITLDRHSYMPILKFCDNRELRREIKLASAYVASEHGDDPAHDVTDIINEILQIRAEKAKLLGFESYADLSVYSKMANHKSEIYDMAYDLLEKSADKSMAEESRILKRARNDGIRKLEPWDIGYYRQKVMVEEYSVDEKEIKKYFGVSSVLEGFFDWAQNLYGITFELDTEVELYHPSVALYHVKKHDQPVAHFMVDLYARPSKRGNAWMSDMYSRMVLDDGTLQLPVATLNCNFAPPVDAEDSLLNHRDIETLFHEFGHCMHHMMTMQEVKDVAGISGVEWDAVELPSQMQENWCWDYEVLAGMSSHYQTGEKLPRELYDQMLAAKNAFTGTQTQGMMEMVLFDMLLHDNWPDTVAECWRYIQQSSMSILPEVKNTRWFHSFHHIWEGAYAAGYYSYTWAEILSADCFSKFEEQGIFDTETGQRFCDEILAQGSSRPAIESVKAFLGREPNSDALVRHLGLNEHE